jgi:2-oxoglutarate dehydrogenase E2 component (dihydrolipoamide succinyltransferase)
VVPVLRNVNKMNFADIEKNIGALGKKARDGQLSIDDMSGGSFTISNGAPLYMHGAGAGGSNKPLSLIEPALNSQIRPLCLYNDKVVEVGVKEFMTVISATTEEALML